MRLTDKERITILMKRGFGDRIRSYQEVINLFNNTYIDRPPILKSSVYRTVDRFERTGSIKDEPRSGSPKDATNDDKALEILLSIIENPHTMLTKLSQSEISITSVRRILQKHKYPYKMHLVQELSEDDFDRKIEFCDTMMT